MNTFEFVSKSMGETFHFDMEAEKIRAPIKMKSDDWTETATHWRVTLTQREYGNQYSLDYYTGRAIVESPKVGDVITSIALDVAFAGEMPDDEMAAMDYYESNYEKSEKSSVTLRIIRAVKLARENVKKLLANTGITLDEFIEACSED